jgi:hypothetical protein
MIRVVVLVVGLLASYPRTRSLAGLRKAVAQYGEAAVEAWACAKGISGKEIEKARRCLR